MQPGFESRSPGAAVLLRAPALAAAHTSNERKRRSLPLNFPVFWRSRFALRIEDTIAAIATPPGQGALGIVRLSGKNAAAITREVLYFKPDLRPRSPVLAQLRDSSG